MRRSYLLIIPVLLGCLLAACNHKTTTFTYSSDTDLVSLTFAPSDSFPGLAEAKFTIDLNADTAQVYNVDSLRYGTRLDSVVATFRFNKSVGYAWFYPSDTDSVLISSGDTLNFTAQPCLLYVRSSDNTASRWYHIYVNVHTVDPDLYVWQQLPAIPEAAGADVQALLLGDTKYIFCHDGITTRCCRLTADDTWETPQQATGLPADVDVQRIVASNQAFYYAADGALYRSEDGVLWQLFDLTQSEVLPTTLIAYYNDSVWAIADDHGSRCLAVLQPEGFVAKQQLGTLREDFPASHFASCVFLGETRRPRLLLLGGFTADGRSLNSRWSIEYRHDGTYRMQDFSIEQPSFAPLTGASLVAYDGDLLLFGSANSNAEIGEYPILLSTDEGMNWSVPDSAHCLMPEGYEPRQRQAALVDTKNMIYLFGGRNRTTIFSDAWKGYRNDINWVDATTTK